MIAEHTPEHIVYVVDTEDCPPIRYRAIPSECAGSASTLDEARASYRAQLTRLLRVDRRQLPHVIEHIESRVHGIRVREQIGTVHRDHYADRMLLQTLLAGGTAQDQVRHYVEQVAVSGIDPVVLLLEPDEPVGAVLDQMTPRDTVVVTHSDPASQLGWAAICGPEVCPDAHADNVIATSPEPGDAVLRGMAIDEFTRRYRARAVRVSRQGLARAS